MKKSLIFSLSYPFAFFGQAIKEFLQAKEKVVIVNLTIICAAILNVIIGYPLTFGIGEYIPELGIVGLAISAVIVRVLMAFFLMCVFIKHYPIRQWTFRIRWDFIITLCNCAYQ